MWQSRGGRVSTGEYIFVEDRTCTHSKQTVMMK